MSVRKKQSFIVRFLRLVLFIPFLPILIPLILLIVILNFLHRSMVYLLVWLLWLPRGKDVLFVSSDSSVWQQYMETQILPFVETRAIVLNWSERKKWSWWSLERRVFRVFGGRYNFNPMVVLFRPFRRARIFRFFLALEEWKHGHTEKVDRLRRDLTESL
jgi:hypothetical protein